MGTSLVIDYELEDLEMMPEWWFSLAICYLLYDLEFGTYVGGEMVKYNIDQALRYM